MAVYKELNEAINKILQETNETDEFKKGFKMLIQNFLENSFTEDDIREMLNLVTLKGGEGNEGQDTKFEV